MIDRNISVSLKDGKMMIIYSKIIQSCIVYINYHKFLLETIFIKDVSNLGQSNF